MTLPLSIPFSSPAEVEASLAGTIAHLAAHRVLAYPTETVYGLGGATDQESVDALMELKSRAPAKPFLILVASDAMLERLGLPLSGYAARLAARHWPGPLTLVLPGAGRRVPEQLRGPEGGIAVRWTSHPALQRLLQKYGEPVTSTSANKPGTPPAMSAREVEEQWSDAVGQGILRVLDGGTLVPSPPSTVVDCTGRSPRIIRPGAIASSVLREGVPDLIGDV